MRPKAEMFIDHIVQLLNVVPSDGELKELHDYMRGQLSLTINDAYGQGLKDAGGSYERIKSQIIDHALACGIDLADGQPEDITDTWLWVLESVAEQHKQMLEALEAVYRVLTPEDGARADHLVEEALRKAKPGWLESVGR